MERSGLVGVLRGNAPAKIDDKGRLKVPNSFRAVIQKDHGAEVFVTSLTGQSVRIYPMPVWVELDKRLAQVPSTNPARQRFLDRVNFYGQVAELDAQGRVVIQPRLRESAQISGDVLHNPGLAYAMAMGMVAIMGVSIVLYSILQRRSERWLR